jgi:hypothetical protein
MRPSRCQQVLVSKEPFFRLIDCVHSWRFPRCLTPSYFRSTHCAFSFSSQVFLKVELIFSISFFLHAHTIATSHSLSSAQYFLLSYFSEKFNFSLYFSCFVLNFSNLVSSVSPNTVSGYECFLPCLSRFIIHDHPTTSHSSL